jgi:hypothetical protein
MSKAETRCEFMWGRAPRAVEDRPDIIPIPLRAGFTARVHIPLDITEREARKIGAVLVAYASGMEARQGGDVKQAPSRSDDSPTAESGDAQPIAQPIDTESKP